MDFSCSEFTDPPTANVSFPSFTCQGNVQFADISTGLPSSWSWDFGDGSTSTEQNPSHIYVAPGTYSISLTVCNDNGCDTFLAVDALTYNSDDFACTNGVTMPQSGAETTNLCSGVVLTQAGQRVITPKGFIQN